MSSKMNVTKDECDSESYEGFQKIFNALEQEFKNHYALLRVTLKEQRNLLHTMWVLCQRYCFLTRGAICVRPYPREPSHREEREIKQMFIENMKLLQQSNNKLISSLCTVEDIPQVLNGGLSDVYATLPRSIVESRRPIYYYIELFSDLCKFFHTIEHQLKRAQRLMMVDDIGSVLEYKHLLEFDEMKVSYFNYQYFEQCLTHCDSK